MTMMLILGGFHRWILMWRWNTTWSTNRGSIGRQAADQQGTSSRPCHFALDPWIAHELVLPLSCMKVVCWGSIYSWCSSEQIIFSSAVWSIPCYPYVPGRFISYLQWQYQQAEAWKENKRREREPDLHRSIVYWWLSPAKQIISRIYAKSQNNSLLVHPQQIQPACTPTSLGRSE
jgi:hypothetical protein